MVGALVFQVFVAIAPASATIVTMTDTDSLKFNRTNGYTNIVGTGTSAGDLVLYKNVGSFGGVAVDAVITTVSINGSISNYDNVGSASTNADYFQVNTTGGDVTMKFSFYEAGTYTGANTGIPVIIQGLRATAIDLDSSSTGATYQYTEFTGFQKYSLTSPTNLAVQPLTSPNRVRFVATKSGMRTSVPEDQVLVRYDAAQSFTITMGNVSTGQTNYFGLAFGPWPGTGTPVEYSNAFNTPPTSTDTSLYYASGVPTVLPLSAFGNFADADGNTFYAVRIASLPASGSLEYFNGAAWVPATLNQVISTSDISLGELRYTGTASTSLTFAVSDALDYSVVNYTLSLLVSGATQSITFPNPGTQTSGTTLDSQATSDSGESVTLTSLTPGVCSVDNVTMKITTLANGTCSIVASQAGNANYAAATSVTQTFMVSGDAAQTITFAKPADTTTAYSPVASGATASSGLTVTLASLTTTVCSVTGLSINLLSPGTCTIRATQAGGTNGGTTYSAASPVERSFLVTVGPPTARTDTATGIASTSATLNGSVTGFGASTTVQFCLSATSTMSGRAMTACTAGSGRVSATPATITAASATSVSYAAIGLTTGSTYYFQVIATSASGTTYGDRMSFTPAAVYVPTATTMPVTSLSSSTTATLAGVVSANGAATTTAFCWNSTSPAVNAAGRLSSCTSITGTAVAANGVNTAVSGNITSGLATGKTYYYQVSATNSAGTVYGAVLKFVARASVTQTTAATSITASGATLNGNVNTGSNSRTSTVTFCLSTSDANTVGVLNTCAQTVSNATTVTGTSAVNVSAAVSGLASSKTYYFQVKSVSSRGAAYINYGAILSFTTSATAPTVQTLVASAVLATSATLNGEVNPNLGNAIAKFCYGTSPTLVGCTTETATPGAISGGSTVGVSLVLGNLNSLTTYYFRVSATNATGTTNGSILSFTTGGPVAITTAATGVSGSAARLNGAVKAQGAAAVNNAFCYGTLESVTAGKLNACTTVAGIDPTSTGYSATPIYASITGLAPGSTYFFQTVASRSVSGTTYYAYGDVLSFVAADVPLVTTDTVTSKGPETATLRGTVTANGSVTTASFCFSLSGATADGQVLDACGSAANWVSSTQGALAAGSIGVQVSGDATGLRPGTTYYYQAVAENSRGTVYGGIRLFTTGAAAPTVKTLPAVAGTNSAALNGTALANGAQTTVTFCWATSYTVNVSCTLSTTASPGSINGNSTYSETGTATGLLPGTTYYYQIYATNSAGAIYGAVETFTVGAPSVTTQVASNVASTTASLNGSVATNGSNVTTISFNYTSDSTFADSTTVVAYTGSLATDTTTSVGITNLIPNTTYWFRIIAQNGRGTSFGNWISFTAGAPTVVTSAATSTTPTSAKLNGTVNANGAGTATPYFCYSTNITDTGDLADCTYASGGADINGSTPTAISAILTGLLPGTIYYFQASADTPVLENTLTVSGQVLSFTTPVDTPTVTTNAATVVTSTGATLNGSVNPGGASTAISFCYGTASNLTGCTTVAADQSPASGTDSVWSTKTLTGLIPGTTYYFTVRATNSAAGPISGSILSFTTPAIAPTVTTDTATAISQTGATLNGTVNPGGATTSVTFCYGTAANLAGCTLVNATPSSISGNSNLPESYTVTGLSPSTTYYYRVSATNSAGGPIDGSIRSFTTSALVMQTITFNANGGSPATDSQTVVNNVQTALKSNSFSRTGYHFTGWDTSVAGTTVVYANGANVTLVANLSLYAVWAIDTFTLTSSAGAHGSITSTITTSYGATETFTVTANAGYHVDTVTVDGSAASLTNGKYVFSNVNANHTISVSFAIDTFTITSTAGLHGSITSTINTTYGATETFTVTADSGYHVASVLVDGSAASLAAGKYVFSNVTANHTISVTFAIDTFTITSSAGAHGSITSTTTTNYGATETFTVTPAVGYHVDTFTVDGSPASLTDGKYVFSNVTANHTISVTFAIDGFTLTSTAGAHGSITSNINTTYGATETFTVTADLGYHVESVTVDGSPATLTAGKYVFGNVSANHSIAVTFAIDAFTLTSSAGAHGSITSTINTTYGATETFTVTVDPGYHVETLTVDGSVVTLTDGKYAFTNVTANHAIVATFAIDAFTITSNAGAHGSITSTINTTYGATETFTVAANLGYHVETLTVDGSPAVLTDGLYVFSNVTANHTISVTFAIDTFTITSSAGAHGTITSSIDTTHGATETFTVTVDTGYHVETVTVDGNEVTLTNGKYVFTNVTANHTIAVTFAIDTFTITSTAGAHGSITPTINTTHGATETFIITVDPGYHVETVTVDGSAATLTDGQYVFTSVTANHTISVTFAIDTFTVTTSAGAHGSITSTVNTSYGATETITVTANSGYHVETLTVDGSPATLTAGKYVFSNITANHTISVTFAIDTFTVTTSAGAHGTITASIDTTYGATETITVSADTGYHVASVTVDSNPATLTAGKYVFTSIAANHTIAVTFAIDTYTVTTSAGAHGTITASIDTTYGATETITVSADTGYHVASVTVDSNPATLTAGKYVFTSIAANHTIAVTFAIDTYTVTASAGSNGSIAASGAVTVNHGSTETFTVTANTGYHVDTVTVDGSPATLTNGKYVFVDVTGAHTIDVTFAIDTFTVTTSAGAHGSISASIDTTYGATETVTVTANIGYHLATVTVDDNAATLTAGQYVFTDITANHSIAVTFAIDTHTVTFSANGGSGSMSNSTVNYGQPTSLPSNTFTRTGHHFAGWALSSNGTIELGDADTVTVTSDIELFALWEADTYTLTFAANGGSGSMADLEFTYGVSESLTANAFTRNGFTFAGWALSANGSVVYTDAQSVTPATSITLYAVWNAIATPPAPQPPAPQPPAFDPKSLKFDTQTVVATTPGSGPIGGLPTGALIQVSPTLLPKTPGIALATYADGRITFTAAPGFSGKTYIPLEIISNGVTTVVLIPVFVNPAAASGTFTPQTAARTTITWAPSPNAIGYILDINGKVVCNTTTTSCDLAKLIGPATKIVLTALGNDGTKATSTLPAYAPEHPVEISVLRFAPNSAKLNPLGKQMLDKLVTLLKTQGFTRLVIRGYTDSQGGTKNAAALSMLRAKAVAKYLRKFIKVGVITVGKGVSDPAAPNSTATGQSLNRRALVLVW